MRVVLNSINSEALESSKSSRAAQSLSSLGPRATAPAGGNSSSDQASFSFDQIRVQSLTAQALAQPEVREAKVQSLRQAIHQDQYSVSPGQIAEALARDFGGLYAPGH